MMDKNGKRAEPSASSESHLVVVLPQLALITQLLTDVCEARFTILEQDTRLSLALVNVHDLQAVAERLIGKRTPPQARVNRPMDKLLGVLRRHCADQYGGWMPTIGKNRDVKTVFAAPHIGTGGAVAAAGYPSPPTSTPQPLPSASDSGRGHGVRVGVLDTQIFPNDQLGGRYTTDSRSLLAAQHGPLSHYRGHATFVAGLILREAPCAELEVRGVLHGDEPLTTTWQLAREMARMADRGIDVLNMSLACQTDDGLPPLALSRAVDLLSPDMVIVAAAGNIDNKMVDGKKPMWPAALDKVIAVGATYQNGRVADFSPRMPWIDILAPGVDVVSTYLSGNVDILHPDGDASSKATTSNTAVDHLQFNGWATWSGTSFAAATVTGRIAAFTRPEQSARSGLASMVRAVKSTDSEGVRLAKYHEPGQETPPCQMTTQT